MITRHDEGFTLIESLVAFAVLSMAIIMSFRIFGEGLQRVNRAEEVKAQMEAAHLEMQHLTSQLQFPEGERIESVGGHRWRIVTRRYRSVMSMNSATDDVMVVQLFSADERRASQMEPMLEALLTTRRKDP
jgi:prepilin-type N-terminal cleavage/methylation domain-containing protein